MSFEPEILDSRNFWEAELWCLWMRLDWKMPPITLAVTLSAAWGDCVSFSAPPLVNLEHNLTRSAGGHVSACKAAGLRWFLICNVADFENLPSEIVYIPNSWKTIVILWEEWAMDLSDDHSKTLPIRGIAPLPTGSASSEEIWLVCCGCARHNIHPIAKFLVRILKGSSICLVTSAVYV